MAKVRLSELYAGEETEAPKPKGALDDIFDEEPVPLDVFVQDKKYLGNPSLSPVQFEAVRHIERIYLPDLYPKMAKEFGGYWKKPVRMVNFITLQWGKGSGKDHICRIASLRVAYLLMCLNSPQDYFGVPEQDSIHMLNIASSAAQADTAFFRPMVRAVEKGWFKDRAEPKQGFIRYDKNIEAISGHSDSESQEGGNLILGVLDEIDAFKTREELARHNPKALRDSPRSAEAILKMTRTSASTRFPANFKNVRISYPRYLGSTIQRLTEEGNRDQDKWGKTSRHFVSGPLATWDVNPLRTQADFETEYREDPSTSKAMYECKPSRATDAYFRNMEMFRQSVDTDIQPIQVEYVRKEHTSAVTGEKVTSWDVEFHIDPSFQPITGARYAMHGDLAIKGDRAGIAMSHVQSWDEKTEMSLDGEGNEVEWISRVPTVRNDFTIAFESDLRIQPPREIQINWARKLAFLLISKGFYVTRFTFDGFQSTDSMQTMESHGIETEKVSADIGDSVYKTLRDVTYDGRFSMPFDQILMNEIESLTRFGGKVDHPPGGSKDLSDALACSVVGAIETGGEESVDGSLVDIGTDWFEVGPALAPLYGQDEVMNPFGLPIGMSGVDWNG